MAPEGPEPSQSLTSLWTLGVSCMFYFSILLLSVSLTIEAQGITGTSISSSQAPCIWMNHCGLHGCL